MAVKVTNEAGHVVLHSNQLVITEQEAKACVEALQAQSENPPLVIFDFSEADEITLQGVRMLTRVAGSIANEAKIVIVAKKNVEKLIKEQGLDRLFTCCGNLSDVIPGKGGEQGKQQTLEFLNTTLEAVSYTIKVATNTEAKAGKSQIRQPDTKVDIEIASVIGIISTPFRGTLILGFPMKTYLALMSRMLGEEYKELTPGIRDGAAELLNIILGHAKISLNEKGYSIKQAIPTVVSGSEIQVHPSTSRPSVIVPYTTDVGNFYVELTTTVEPKR